MKPTIEDRPAPAPTGDSAGKLVERLRRSHPTSVQAHNGSNILLEAADMLESFNSRLEQHDEHRDRQLRQMTAAFEASEQALRTARDALQAQAEANRLAQDRSGAAGGYEAWQKAEDHARKLISAALAGGEEEPLSSPSAWQSIETAPRDGRIINLWAPGWHCVRNGQFSDGRWKLIGDSFGKYEPTDWAPLLAPPERNYTAHESGGCAPPVITAKDRG